MKEINNLLYARFPGNLKTNVRIFFLKNSPNRLLTLPIKFESESVIVASTNPYSTWNILNSFPECQTRREPYYLVKHRADMMGMPLVTFVGCFCNFHNHEEVNEVHYYLPYERKAEDVLKML